MDHEYGIFRHLANITSLQNHGRRQAAVDPGLLQGGMREKDENAVHESRSQEVWHTLRTTANCRLIEAPNRRIQNAGEADPNEIGG